MTSVEGEPRLAAAVAPQDRFAERPQFLSLGWGEVSALLVRPPDATAMLAFAHGAGAGIEHPFMSDMAQRLAALGMASLRYQFPYMEARSLSGRRRPPDRPHILIETVRAAVAKAGRLGDDLPLFAGGKSMGGRMSSSAAAEAPFDGVRGLVFFGFPLHPPGKPGTERSDHLSGTALPMLFLQGTRDKLADLELLEPVCRALGSRAALHIVDGADHSFHVLKRSGRTDSDVAQELAVQTVNWAREIG